MHPIQQFILLQLSENEGLRYSDIKPRSMEAAQFMYHLKQLSASGLVNKSSATYSLTPLGIQYIDRLNEQNLSPFSYPRIALALIYKSPTKGILLSRRSRHPGIGKVGFILIDLTIDFVPPLKQAATEAFFGITKRSIDFNHRADGYIMVCDNGAAVANMLSHVFTAEGQDFIPSSKELVWQNEVNNNDIFVSTWLVLKDLESKKDHFFFEHTIDLNS